MNGVDFYNKQFNNLDSAFSTDFVTISGLLFNLIDHTHTAFIVCKLSSFNKFILILLEKDCLSLGFDDPDVHDKKKPGIRGYPKQRAALIHELQEYLL